MSLPWEKRKSTDVEIRILHISCIEICHPLFADLLVLWAIEGWANHQASLGRNIPQAELLLHEE